MKSCELCKSQARVYCESDQASLCWSCDLKVHSANFLVARHSRSLLCHVCRSPTAWSASGEKLGRTVSVCQCCVDGSGGALEESEGCNGDAIDTEGDGGNDENDGDDDDRLDVGDEDGDNQVVPWSSTSPPPAASSSTSEECSSRFSNGDGEVSSKRMPENVTDLCSSDNLGYSSSQQINQTPKPATAAPSTGGGEATFLDLLSLRPLKKRRIEVNRMVRVKHTAATSSSVVKVIVEKESKCC